MRTAGDSTAPGLFQKVKLELAANRQKAAILGVLAIVFLGAIVRMFLVGASPDEAAAEAPLVVASTLAATPQPLARPVSQPLSAGEERQAVAKAVPQDGRQSVPSEPGRAASRIKPVRAVSVRDLPRTLARDIFDSSDWTVFVPDVGVGAADDQAATTAQPAVSMWRQMREAMVERKQHRAQQREELTKELAELQLQSTMTGPAPAAYISGRLVHKGDTIRGFSVVDIGDKGVKLRKNGITTFLTMP